METKKFFEKEDEFLKLLYDKDGKLYSKSRIFARVKISPELLIEKKFTLEYCDINMYEDGLVFTDAILKNNLECLCIYQERILWKHTMRLRFILNQIK
jgi:hypothetical protein